MHNQNQILSINDDQFQEILHNYLIQKDKQSFLTLLKLITPLQHYTSYQNKKTFYHSFYQQIVTILRHHKNSLNNSQCSFKKVLQFNESEIWHLVYLYQRKICYYLIQNMKNNSLLKNFNTNKLMAISRTHKLVQLKKYSKIIFKHNLNNSVREQSPKYFYLLLKGEIQKIRYFPQKPNNRKQLAYHSMNHSSFQINKKRKSQNLEVQLSRTNVLPIHQNNLMPISHNKNKSMIRTFLGSGEFIGDDYIYSIQNGLPFHVNFFVNNQRAFLIRFDIDIVLKFFKEYKMNAYRYDDENQNNKINDDKNEFYDNKSLVQQQKAKNIKKFNKKFLFKRKMRQQNRLKKQLSPEMKQVRQGIIKRHLSSLPNIIDNLSPKDINRRLSMKKKKLGIKLCDLDNPVVQVFETHSQKYRSFQKCALNPLAIVKTRNNNQLFNNEQNILDKNQKSQIYKVRSWNSKYDVNGNSLSLELKNVQQVVKKRRKSLGGFNSMENQRIIEKYKKSIKF